MPFLSLQPNSLAHGGCLINVNSFMRVEGPKKSIYFLRPLIFSALKGGSCK